MLPQNIPSSLYLSVLKKTETVSIWRYKKRIPYRLKMKVTQILESYKNIPLAAAGLFITIIFLAL